MQRWISRHGFSDDQAMLDYAYALANHYGEAIGALACQMYEATAAAQGVVIQAAEAAEMPTYKEVAIAVHGTMKQSEKKVPATVGRLVKQVGADTTLKNAERDGAQFAWVPQGDTCAFCIVLASRGWQYMSKKTLKNGHAEHIHANCDCQYAVRFDGKSEVAGYNPDVYLEMYENADGFTAQEKIAALRRSIYKQKKQQDTSNPRKKKGYIDSNTMKHKREEKEFDSKTLEKADENIIIKSAKENGINGVVSIKPKPLNLEEYSFDDEHVNAERKHNVTREEAERFMKDAKISITRWNGRFINFYGESGAVYIDTEKKNIRTAFKKEEYDDKINNFMKVVLGYGKQD